MARKIRLMEISDEMAILKRRAAAKSTKTVISCLQLVPTAGFSRRQKRPTASSKRVPRCIRVTPWLLRLPLGV